jgi:hypothetical protein
MIDDSGKVLSSHILLVEVPILSRAVIILKMGVRELRAAVVAHPNIVPLLSKDEGRGQVGTMSDKLHHIAVLSMHEQYSRLFSTGSFSDFTWNSANSKDITVRCG